jgi:hypothetical protein
LPASEQSTDHRGLPWVEIMKIVPSLSPLVTVAKAELGVEALAPVKAAKPVQPGTQSPLAAQLRVQSHALSDIAGQAERRYDVQTHGERRTYCRRIEHLPILVELRAGYDRRRHNQRGDDMMDHVDEKV